MFRTLRSIAWWTAFLAIGVPGVVSRLWPLSWTHDWSATASSTTTESSLHIDRARLEVCIDRVGAAESATPNWGPVQFLWIFKCERWGGVNAWPTGVVSSTWRIELDLIWPAAALGILGIASKRKPIRLGPGCCRLCWYDLQGLPADAPCPECGATIPTSICHPRAETAQRAPQTRSRRSADPGRGRGSGRRRSSWPHPNRTL